MDATYAYTSIAKLISRAKIRLRITHLNTEDIFLRDCVVEAAKEMCTRQDFQEKTEVLPIKDFTAILPCDFVTFDRGNQSNPPLVFTIDGKVANNGYASNFSVTYTGGPFINCTPYNTNFNCGIPIINVQDGRIYFSENIDSVECKISYLGLNIDADGTIRIPENNSRPILNYVYSEYGMATGDIDKATIAQYIKIWTQGKFDRRGQSQLLSVFEKEQLRRIMNN